MCLSAGGSVMAQEGGLPYREWMADRETIRPPYLQRGDTVGIIAISTRVTPQYIERVRERFEVWGLSVRYGKHILSEDDPSFAGTDEQRASDLQDMIDDPAVKAIVFYRGGYGAVRIMDMVDLSPLRQNPKWLTGFSDITLLHLALNRLRIESIHSTMPVLFLFEAQRPDPSPESLRDALFGEIHNYSVQPHSMNIAGQAEGRLVGGNLSIIYSAAGTRFDLNLDEPSILFIEDVDEYIYHIDRMLHNLKLSGKLDRIKGVVVGHFADMKANRSISYEQVEELIHDMLKPYNIPVMFGFPAGHDRPNMSIYLGRRVYLSVTEDNASMTFAD